jgi:hypothetical protein
MSKLTGLEWFVCFAVNFNKSDKTSYILHFMTLLWIEVLPASSQNPLWPSFWRIVCFIVINFTGLLLCLEMFNDLLLHQLILIVQDFISHNTDYEEFCLLGCNAVDGRWKPTNVSEEYVTFIFRSKNKSVKNLIWNRQQPTQLGPGIPEDGARIQFQKRVLKNKQDGIFR